MWTQLRKLYIKSVNITKKLKKHDKICSSLFQNKWYAIWKFFCNNKYSSFSMTGVKFKTRVGFVVMVCLGQGEYSWLSLGLIIADIIADIIASLSVHEPNICCI